MRKVDIIFPVYYGNYSAIEGSVKYTTEFCRKYLTDYKWRLIVSINGPKPEDNIALVTNLMTNIPELSYKYTPTPGKGSGIKNAWLNSESDILAYMDIDLSVDLSCLPILLDNVGKYDIVVGSRYDKQSNVKRNAKRKIISKIYHKIFQDILLQTHFSDAHCGFKAIRGDLAQILLYHIQDPGWFFDSEFMFLSEKLGYKIKTIPIIWNDSQFESGVSLSRVIPSFILKSLELKMRQLPDYIRRPHIIDKLTKF